MKNNEIPEMRERRYWLQVRKVISECDVILEILDARDPEGTRNYKLERMIKAKGKVLVLVINKVDLVEKERAEEMKKSMKKEYPTVFLSATHRLGTTYLREEIAKKCKMPDMKIGVVGLPNVGKSSVINMLRGRHMASVSPIAGHTHGIQWIRLAEDILLMDTPGVMPSMSKKELLYKGAIDVTKFRDVESAAERLIQKILSDSPNALDHRYGIKTKGRMPAEILEDLAMKTGRLKKGGEPRPDEAARMVIRDWQNGKIKL